MIRTISKFATVLLSVLIVFALFPGKKIKSAEIKDQGNCGTDGSNVTWTLDSDGMLTIYGTGGMKAWDLNQNNSPFRGNTNIKKVVIEDGVTSISNYAFLECTSLTSITIPDSVTSIGSKAFWNCTSLTSITIPDSVTSIGNSAFELCTSLTSITIPNSVKVIGNDAFCNCRSLTSITIPNRVTSISDNAFVGCRSLTSITIPNSVTSIGICSFWACTSLTSITIPDSVTSIGIASFSDCTSLTSITIPNSVKSIGNGAFDGCTSLTSVTIPNSVTSIGNGAFEKCWRLSSVRINKKLYEKYKDFDVFYGVSPDAFDYYYNATYETSTVGGSISGNAKTYETDEITIKPDQHYSVDKVVLTVKDKNGNDVEKELSPANGKYLMPDYDFNNWTGDCKVTVSFKPVTYKVTFKNQAGVILQEEDLEYGVVPAYKNATPEKDQTKENTYTFSAWNDGTKRYGVNEQLPQVTGAVTYTAEFTEHDRLYKVTFTDSDGGVIQADKLGYGAVPEYKGKTPEKEETKTSIFTFDGWTNGSDIYGLTEKLPGVTADVTYSPVYKEIIKGVYTVGEVKGDGANSDIVIDVHRNVNDENCIDYFSSATIDDTEMKINDQYTATKGSTIITIKKEYLSTLTAGEHEVNIIFSDGSIKTKVTVAAKANTNIPATGEVTGAATYAGLALIVAACVCGAAGVVLVKRRKEV